MGLLLSGDRAELTITAELNKNSGSYTCKGRHNTKDITTASSNPEEVTIHNNPKPELSRNPIFSPMYPPESVTFSCKVDVGSEWEYLWYFNGLLIQGQNSETYTIQSITSSNNGQYRCKAKRGPAPFSTEESQPVPLQVSALPKTVLSLVTPWHNVFENEILEFHCNCSCDPGGWTISWYRNQKQLQEDKTIEIEDSMLNITSVTKADEGGYTCRVSLESRRVRSQISEAVAVKVYDKIPKPTIRKSPTLNPMYVGETVTFTCLVDEGSDWAYQWNKDGQPLAESGNAITIRLDSSRQGKYSCEANRGQTTTTPASDELAQDVLKIPVPSLKPETQWLDVYPTESVRLSCAMGNSVDWTYKWFKDGREIPTETSHPNGAILSIGSASAADAGQYKCEGHLKRQPQKVKSHLSSGVSLTVYDEKPRISLTLDPNYTPMFSGESVSFTCRLNTSQYDRFEYLWFKNGQKLDVSGNHYTLRPVEITHRGPYTCQAKRGQSPTFFTDWSSPVHFDVRGVKPKPTMTQQPGFNEMYIGESVNFTCNVSVSTGWEYRWYKDGVRVHHSGNSINFNNLNTSNSGSYECMAKRHVTSYETHHSEKRILKVSEIPVPSLTPVTQWLDVFPTETVKLHCQMKNTLEWTYTWYKDEQEVQVNDVVHLEQSTATLSINAAISSRGNYKCSGKLRGRSVYSPRTSELQLSVYDAKPTVTLVQNPSHILIYSGDPVSFSCHINVSDGWEYQWYKNGKELVTVTGNSHNITSVLTKDSGSYRCQTKRGEDFKSEPSPAVELDVKERPQADIILLTGWSEVFSTDSLVLKCGVKDSPDSWNYTWFKEDQPIPSEASEKHIVTPDNDPNQSQYSCQGIRTGNPSYSKISDNFTTKNLLLKRRVLLAISGCIVFGIAAVILGCIALRIFRKPVKEEYKPEEADLFVSMARQKDGDDTSCPLVEFITNASLNSPPKEEEENGMICSEATPLPITTQGDQAVTTEDPGASETNGGLVSFKQ
ncbi:uncharacterized protein V6R79_007280 [Siganus canaliculatus]